MPSATAFRVERAFVSIAILFVLINTYRVDLSIPLTDQAISHRLLNFHSGGKTKRGSQFVVDILSVSSTTKLDLLRTQQRTFASHISVRNFFNATELDDADPGCYKYLTSEDVSRISTFCRGLVGREMTNSLLRSLKSMPIDPKWLTFDHNQMCARGRTYRGIMEAYNLTLSEADRLSNFCRLQQRQKEPQMSKVLKFMKTNYARNKWLEKKENPTGWMCAQGRPYSGLKKVQRHYADTNEELPDFLIIMDDDTYFNMELFQQNFEQMNSSDPTYYAGCLIRYPIGPNEVNLTVPYGGFGSILSAGALRNLFHPIRCPTFGLATEKEALLNEATCNRLEEDNVWERHYFKNGMSLADLMYHYVSTERYRDVSSWTTGYCMHSDWVIGYVANFYNVSKHVAPTPNEWVNKSPHARIEAYKGSQIYDKPVGLCNNEGSQCKDGSDICHRAEPAWMEMETERWQKKVPNKFKPV